MVECRFKQRGYTRAQQIKLMKEARERIEGYVDSRSRNRKLKEAIKRVANESGNEW